MIPKTLSVLFVSGLISIVTVGCSGFSNSSHKADTSSINSTNDGPTTEASPPATEAGQPTDPTPVPPQETPVPVEPAPHPVTPAPTHSGDVRNLEELMAALNAASGGEMITLATGSYGNLKINNLKFHQTVTLRSANPDSPAEFESIEVNDSNRVRFQYIHVNHSTNGLARKGLINIARSDYIEVLDSEINGSVPSPRDLQNDDDYIAVPGRFQSGYGVQAREGSDHVVIQGNDIHDIETGAVFFGVSNLKVSHNQFEYIGGDSLKFAGVLDSEISYNVGAKHVITEPDMHIDFIQFQGSSSGILLKGNVLLAAKNNKNGVYQGIFMNNGTYTNIQITDNLIYTNTVNAIFLNSTTDAGSPTGNNIFIERNTVLSPPDDSKWDRAEIRLMNLSGRTYSIRNNVVDRVDDQVSGGIVANNLLVQFKNASQPNHYNRIYQNGTAGTSASLADFRPIQGGPGDYGSGLGAERTIQYLLQD